MRDMAGPEKMPWVRMAYTLVAPADINLETWETEKEIFLPFVYIQVQSLADLDAVFGSKFTAVYCRKAFSLMQGRAGKVKPFNLRRGI